MSQAEATVRESFGMPATLPCPFCSTPSAKFHVVREMMFGLRDPFTYGECAGCGLLWLTDPPADFSRYYPHDYYSFADDYTPSRRRGLGRRQLNRMRLGWFPGGSLIRRYHPEPVLDRLAALDITRQTKLLDIGCGRGTYLYLLRELGVEARGVDPYISEDVSDAFGVRVHRCRLEDMAGEWDIIRMHHSLEHVPDQVGTLRTIRGKLARNGIAVISLPVIGWAWSRYGVNWVGLDAPRHLFLHTKRSLQLVAERAGLTLVGMTYDSTEQQLWASELYSRDIPMRPNGSSQFTTEQLENYRLRAGELNRQEQGDQATFMFARD